MLRRSRSFSVLVGLAVLSAGGLGSATTASAEPPPSDGGRYVVRTKSDTATARSVTRLKSAGRSVTVRYSQVLNGFAAELSSAQVRALRSDPTVESVTPDVRISIAAPSTVDGADARANASLNQAAPPWGLDRIDQRSKTGDGKYGYDTTGAGVTAFLIDSGVKFSHREFGGRAVSGYDFVDGDTDASDCLGHGTHVAGTIGGATYGVAKAVKIVSLRVFDCEGSGWGSDFLSALDWAVKHKPAGPSVVNFSGGSGIDAASDQAVAATVAHGIPVVVAAGNEASPACGGSPARAPQAITVAASDINDGRANFSNYGSCVDLFAPGLDVVSAGLDSNTATATMSGTSMATPHVTGAVARFLQSKPTATPAQVNAALAGRATRGVIADPQGSPNLLLFTSAASQTPGAAAGVVAQRNEAQKTGSLQWSAPLFDGDSAVTGYQVTRSGTDAQGAGQATIDLPATASSHVFNELRAGAAYTLTVRARNAVGLGPAVARTVVATPPSAPTKVTGRRSDKAKSATIAWSVPSSTGGLRIDKYRVTRDGTDARGGGPKTVTVSGSTRSYAFSTLRAGATYNLQVRAITAAGAGPAAGTRVKLTALPGKPRIKTPKAGSTKDKTASIQAYWATPTSGGAVRSYRIEATRTSSGKKTTVTRSAKVRGAKITGLKRGASYKVRVFALNDAGTGSASKTSTAVKAR
ncbi:MAG: putative family peptidase [Propionibacteriaceae bacterium]|nr:putative family peptidase [Propionibacteriaceae bacterium]